MTTFRIDGQKDLKEFLAKIRAHKEGKPLRQAMAKAMRELGKPVVKDVQQTVKTLPVKGIRGGGTKRRRRTAERQKKIRKGGHGLRASIARGVKSSVRLSGNRVGLTIRVDNSHLPRSQRNLPKHLDNPKGWRHPLFGDSPWYRQVGKPYFRVTIAKHVSTVRRGVQKAVDDIMEELR